MRWSERVIRKKLESKGFIVKEVSLPSKGYERGKDDNVFNATISKDGKLYKEVYLGYNSVKGCLTNIDYFYKEWFSNEK